MTATMFERACLALEVDPRTNSERWAKALELNTDLIQVHQAVTIDDLRLLANAVGVLNNIAAMALLTSNERAVTDVTESAGTLRTLVIVMAEAKQLITIE